MNVMVFSFCQFPQVLNLHVNMCEMGLKSTLLVAEFK